MSYDLMVFAADQAPRDRTAFMQWYDAQTQWREKHDYRDPQVTTPALRAWYADMIKQFLDMDDCALDNADWAEVNQDEVDEERLATYSIGHHIIYACFAWPAAEEAHQLVRELAIRHGVGFFDVSAADGEILFPEHSKDVS